MAAHLVSFFKFSVNRYSSDLKTTIHSQIIILGNLLIHYALIGTFVIVRVSSGTEVINKLKSTLYKGILSCSDLIRYKLLFCIDNYSKGNRFKADFS